MWHVACVSKEEVRVLSESVTWDSNLIRGHPEVNEDAKISRMYRVLWIFEFS
jgi:hypothetical protein